MTTLKFLDGGTAFLSTLGRYDIAIPVRVGPDGEPLDAGDAARRPRRRRGAAERPPDSLFYQLSTPHNDFLLNLTLQGGLLSPQLRVEYWKKGRLAWSRPYSPRCHYAGHLQDRPHASNVALSNCNGLQGVIVAGGEEYLIEPLVSPDNQTGAERGRGAEGRPHVVYKRSSLRHQYKGHSCGVTDEKPLKGASWWQRTLKTPLPAGRGQLPLKRSVSRERYVETLVVADKMMVGYHGRRDIEQYVLAVMNIVAKLFQDSSLGNAVHVVVTRLILLMEDQEHPHACEFTCEMPPIYLTACLTSFGDGRAASSGNRLSSHISASHYAEFHGVGDAHRISSAGSSLGKEQKRPVLPLSDKI
ncbi:A disintegrin and metalloproteinase with thrombospondin motifs 10 [Liparis tanakae]|uniref:A disintegrin and metalloproteinase with thrombospondin motifs 10 n=1 Tax=Liparis tanakae TaxID=230148 RepID=A0A4Z2GVB3_9TELE|nr:A disintegrin and metalloproteinase with thrombospondin motifs 10 [Liparis tanakae]